jgi:ankyrin repeat protein
MDYEILITILVSSLVLVGLLVVLGKCLARWNQCRQRVALESRGSASTMTDIHRAAAAGSVEKIAAYLHHEFPGTQPDVDALDDEGVDGPTVLARAAKAGQIGAMRFLLEHGAKIDAPAGNGATPLAVAAVHRQVEAARMLVELGAAVDAPDALQRTPLHYAAMGNSAEIASLLLSRGANIEARDHEQNTPLLVAADEGGTAVAQVLIEAGADVRAEDQYGEAALDWAIVRACPGLTLLLALNDPEGLRQQQEDVSTRSVTQFNYSMALFKEKLCKDRPAKADRVADHLKLLAAIEAIESDPTNWETVVIEIARKYNVPLPAKS